MGVELENKYNEGIAYNPFLLKWGEEIVFPSTRKMNEYGNRIYNRYPARSVFLVPRAILAQYKNKNLKVLDPFMGSGTTAVEALISGNRPFGTEMDPFARMIADVSTTVFSPQELDTLNQIYNTIQKDWSSYKALPTPDLTGIEHWFKPNDFEDLLKLKACIFSLSSQKYLPYFLVAFADCIKPVSLMERQSTKPYISTKYAKKTKSVRDSFEYSYKAHFEATLQMSGIAKPSPIVWLGEDATDFVSESNSIDIAITSPPYINALDYTRCIKVESAMCGKTDTKGTVLLRKKQVGHESRRHQLIDESVNQIFGQYYKQIEIVDKGRADTCLAYFNDLYKNLSCVHTVLKSGGIYHLIIGDNTIRGVYVPTHEIVARLGEIIGFKWVGYYKYQIKDHRTSLPRNNEKNKIEYEHVIMLQK
ncbi:MAG: site-specific DNA-methyltransferase [Bacteroidales bacterium]|jgi:DNA modification methylase|nr:site-specific DNA-methyltransferase [Bacteroidales bacterium]